MAPSVNKKVVAVGSSSRATSSPLKKNKRSVTVNQEVPQNCRRKAQRLCRETKEDHDHVVVDDELAEDSENLENGDIVSREPCSEGGRKYPPQIDHLLGKVVYSEDEDERSKVRKTLSLFKEISMILKTSNRTSGRVDLEVGTIMKENDKCLNTGKPILGDVPGVEVGDEFECRVEIAIIGLHRHYQGGIDYYNRNGKIIATCIVASEKYADKMDNSDILEYSGQGGRPDKKKNVGAKDQKMERGNLALKNSMDEGTPVRVIRGVKESRKANDPLVSKGKVVSTYTYDGLYLVVSFSEKTGCYNTKDFSFQLRRIAGQPKLALKEVTKSKKSRVRNLQPQPSKKSRVVHSQIPVQDVSQGKEKMPISAVNTVDSEKMPTQFEYITTMHYPSWCNLQPAYECCGCIDGCTDLKECSCSIKNKEIPYNENGAILRAKPFIYECGPCCKCPPTCQNRVSQNGIKFKLELFKTESRGWGVRSLDYICSGSFICEYTGELLKDSQAEKRYDEYLFDISHEDDDEDGFTIDAAQCGNIGRFINHSCSPNLYSQKVLYDHGDKRMPHIMLFAQNNIRPLTELTYHYNYKPVCDSNGKPKKKDCYCGSSKCTGRMY
ncbi:Histone-lysine N-methyltransferase, H3 lysine-9 specific SUVH5 [Thalictrum thalictroides]|uniref:Histone-lysine N-methyltransferase, H3 lysine-9 specific SUVH5 n=1 Tax=Thalictrum thalictroides TaxID=46969 RepID=A0A7J6VYQ2_THATH|nr:Histone-lysine N-methyltransferase, H3 lysine-9 specific SUVH5 [Thalictrum thalictroides]